MVYITEYSELTIQEQRQLAFKRRFKAEHPEWDDSMELLTKLVARRLPPNAVVLDAGCGHGNYVIDELRHKFSRRIGIDVSKEVMAKNRCLDETVVGNLELMPFADASFDRVLSLWVLEHLLRPALVFREIYRVLKPGGYFAFVTPNRQSLLVSLRRLIPKTVAEKAVARLYGRKEQDTFDVYYRANTRGAIRRLAAAAGFAVQELQTNFDPSYTSFGPMSYFLSRLPYQLRFAPFFPHLIGILEKKYRNHSRES